MNKLLPFLFVVCAAAQLSEAATLQQCISRIGEELILLQTNIKTTQHAVWDTLIPSAKNYLLGLTSNLKQDINQGPISCRLWSDYVYSIERDQINDANYKTCKMESSFDKLTKTGKSWVELAKTANSMSLICSMPGSNCTALINNLWNSIILIHNNTDLLINSILTESSACVLRKKESITKSIDNIRSSWKTCVANAN